ncbi:hypothetical protein PM082_022265 [Marasmius tenuissimus]|nr:hypothetical protein PM082_022265 [Marasmius tenuissimus]
MAIHPTNQYLVLGNQNGLIKLYRLNLVEDRCNLQLQWTSNESEGVPSIPRNLAFFGKYILIFWLEAGQISYCELRDDNVDSGQGKLEFDGGIIGNTCFSDPPDNLLIHNLASGNFDIYDFPALSKRRTLAGATHVPIVKQAVFAERNRVAACGSDDGNVYVYDVRSGILLQRLNQRQRQYNDFFRSSDRISIQTIAHFTSKERYLLASGSSTREGTIIVWGKPTSAPPRAWRNNANSPLCLFVFNTSIVLLIVVVVYWLTVDHEYS